MPGIRTSVADLCMFGLAACDEGGLGFVSASVRTITNARRVGVRLRSKCTSTHRHARVNTNNTIEKGETNRNMGANGELKEAIREEVEYIRRHKMCSRVSRETCPRETGRAPIKTAETDKGQPGKPNVRARWVAKEYKTHAGQGCTRQRCHSLCCRRSPRANVEEKLWHWLIGGERTSMFQHEEGYLSNYHQRITSQAMNTCAGCCDTACTARATPHKIGRRSWHLHSAFSNRRDEARARVCGEVTSRERTLLQTVPWRRYHSRWRTAGGGIPHQNDIKKGRDQEASGRGGSKS